MAKAITLHTQSMDLTSADVVLSALIGIGASLIASLFTAFVLKSRKRVVILVAVFIAVVATSVSVRAQMAPPASLVLDPPPP